MSEKEKDYRLKYERDLISLFQSETWKRVLPYLKEEVYSLAGASNLSQDYLRGMKCIIDKPEETCINYMKKGS